MISSENHIGTRIHAIILTQDRPETLRRCIGTALPSLGAQDTLTILDDSLSPVSPANAALLSMSLDVLGPTRIHLSIQRAREIIRRSVSRSALFWLSKTAPRDIAPLRNLSLLLSTAVPAETTILIDDDIRGFDVVATHQRISALAQGTWGVIAGAEIGGINEKDTITRLTDALEVLAKLPPGAATESAQDLFHVPTSYQCERRQVRKCGVSGVPTLA